MSVSEEAAVVQRLPRQARRISFTSTGLHASRWRCSDVCVRDEDILKNVFELTVVGCVHV